MVHSSTHVGEYYCSNCGAEYFDEEEYIEETDRGSSCVHNGKGYCNLWDMICNHSESNPCDDYKEEETICDVCGWKYTDKFREYPVDKCPKCSKKNMEGNIKNE